jgi:histidinol-phosphate phosphatase family protein
MNKAVFFDRDGTIARDVHFCRRPEDFSLFPETPAVMKTLRRHGFKVIIITNQSGIGRGYFDEATLEIIHEKMKADLAREGARLDGVYYCPHHPDDNCACRKPKPALILHAAADLDIDLKSSFMVGDQLKDVVSGQAAGCNTILIGRPEAGSKGAAVPGAIVSGLTDIIDIILKWPEHSRNKAGSLAR